MKSTSVAFALLLPIHAVTAAPSVELHPGAVEFTYDIVVRADEAFRGGELAFDYRSALQSLSRVERGADLPVGATVVEVDRSPNNACSDPPDLEREALTVAWVHPNASTLPAGVHRVLTLHFEPTERFAEGGCFDVSWRSCLGPEAAPVRNSIGSVTGRALQLQTIHWEELLTTAGFCGLQPAVRLAAEEERELIVESVPCARGGCVRIEAPVGKPLFLDLIDANDGTPQVLFAKWGAPPRGQDRDFIAATRTMAAQRLVVPEMRAEQLFVRVETLVEAVDPENARSFSLRARAVDVHVERVTPSLAAEGGRVSVTVLGGGFHRERTRFRLQSSEGSVAVEPDLERSVIVSHDRAELMFLLGDAPRGSYALVVEEQGVQVSPFVDAIEVVAPDLANGLEVSLSGSDLYRNRVPGRATLRVDNVTNAERTAPLFWVRAAPEARDNVRLRLSREGEFRHRDLLVFATDPNGHAGRLPARLSSEVPVFFRGEDCSRCDISFHVDLLTPLANEPVDWLSFPPPAGVEPARWPDIARRLASRLGETWTEVHERTSEIATLLTRRGEDGSSFATAFRFAVREVLGRPSAAVLGRVREAQTRTPVVGATVVATVDGGVRSFGVTDSRGTFAIDWLEHGTAVELEVVGHLSDDREARRVVLPVRGDRYDVELLVRPGTNVWPVVCPNCNESGLPAEAILPPRDTFTPVGNFRTEIASAQDPNEKEGPEGEGPERAVGSEPFVYTVFFENVPTATLAAQRVVITDELDPNLDWREVRLRDVYLGGQLIAVDTLGEDRFNGYRATATGGGFTVPIRGRPHRYTVSDGGGDDLEVHVLLDIEIDFGLHFEGTLDRPTARIVWSIQGLDPTTGAPLESTSRAGILPPNDPGPPRGDGLGQGEGYVSFTASVIDDLEEGDPLANEATIVFDDEKLIRTNTVRNTFSRFPPAAMPEHPVPSSGVEEPAAANLRLCWGDTPFALSYDVRVWRAGGPKPPEPTYIRLETRCTPHLALEAGVVYQWQVVARTVRDEPTEGAVWTFRTASSGIGPFVRGDIDSDGDPACNVTDIVFAASWAFLGGPRPPCLAAADANADGRVGGNVTDLIYCANWSFLGGPPPPAPSPECGRSELGTDRVLGCDDTGRCE